MSATYETSDTVQEVLREKELVPLIGPFAVGKTTLMRAVESLDRRFTRVRSFTTRPMREGEDAWTYEFLPHNVETLEQIRKQAAARNLVQLIVHPTTGYVYGTTVHSYGSDFPMLDVMPTSLPGLESLQFRRMRPTFVVAPVAVWTARMNERVADSEPGDLRKRLDEGVNSLTWALDQGSDLDWLLNGATGIHEVASNLIHSVYHGNSGHLVTAARNMAADLLQEMQALAAA